MADHNLIFLKYFAADESQSLAAIFRNEEGAIDGAVLSRLGSVSALAFINHRTVAMAAEFGKTREQIVTHKCANTWI